MDSGEQTWPEKAPQCCCGLCIPLVHSSLASTQYQRVCSSFSQSAIRFASCSSTGMSLLLCETALGLCHMTCCMCRTSRRQGAGQQAAQRGCHALLPSLHIALYVSGMAQNSVQMHPMPLYQCCKACCTMHTALRPCPTPPNASNTLQSEKSHVTFEHFPPGFHLRDACNSWAVTFLPCCCPLGLQ